MLIDDVTITIAAGNGGNGSSHFLRNGQTTKGGPDGGNGGNGGNIYFQGIDDILGLATFAYRKEIKAESGINGGGQKLFGRNGEDSVVHIPLGTHITDTETGEQWEITNTTEKVLMAVGGKGGRGNKEFATATNQAPTYAEKGTPGQTRTLHLVLKIIADVGFIGLPNAGKSTLLKVLTNANPKIGNYAFTTLEPNLGVLNADVARSTSDAAITQKDRHALRARDVDQRIILADIPGLIEGASKGRGLGTKFLRHVEKTKFLVHCIDSTNEDPVATYQTVRQEITAYSPILGAKPEIILLTKTDLIDAKEVAAKKKQLQSLHKDIYTVSMYDEKDITAVRNILKKSLTS